MKVKAVLGITSSDRFAVHVHHNSTTLLDFAAELIDEVKSIVALERDPDDQWKPRFRNVLDDSFAEITTGARKELNRDPVLNCGPYVSP